MALLASRRPIVVGVLPAVILLSLAYVREMVFGRLLTLESAGNLVVQMVLIIAAAAAAAAAGALVRRSLKW